MQYFLYGFIAGAIVEAILFNVFYKKIGAKFAAVEEKVQTVFSDLEKDIKRIVENAR